MTDCHVSERDVEVTWPAGAERPVASETARTDEEINREEAGQDAEEEQGKRYRRKGDALLDFPPPSLRSTRQVHGLQLGKARLRQGHDGCASIGDGVGAMQS